MKTLTSLALTSDNVALKLQTGVLFSRRVGTDPTYSLTGQLAFGF